MQQMTSQITYGMTILLAEDDVHIREGLSDMLEREGYQVISAENGQVAIDKYRNHNIDFVILDIMMPLLDGYSVCRQIRQHNDSIPIIFLSAKSEEIDKVLGLELGADDYINKPFGVAEVRARIKAVARRCLAQKNTASDTALGDNNQFSFADLTVLPNELRAKRGNEIIELSLREIKILQCLKNHQGKVVTRDMLFDFVWGYDHCPNSRTLDQHISKLRKSIEPNPQHPTLIQTVHGQGYRYE